MTWINTFSGKRIDFDDPQSDQIALPDIARGLANECRFSGQTSRFYSVAQHSLMVLWMVRHAGGDEQAQRQALLHDAAEAYLKDMPSPLKALLPQYREFEEMLWWRIADRFDVPPVALQVVLDADAAALTAEKRELMPAAETWPCDTAWDGARWGGGGGWLHRNILPDNARTEYGYHAGALGLS